MSRRSDFIYQLTGWATKHQVLKNKASQPFLRLTVTIPKLAKIKRLNVFADSCPPAVWQAIVSKEYLSKEYLFCCKNFMGSYYLVKWKELASKEPLAN